MYGVAVDGKAHLSVVGTLTQRAATRWHFAAASRIVLLTCVVIVSGAFCAAIGLGWAKQSDEMRADFQRAALRAAVAEFRAQSIQGAEIDPHVLEMLARGAGLSDLEFVTALPVAGAEAQAVLNAQGRIIGFLTWHQDTPLTALAWQLMPVLGGIGFALIVFAAFAMAQLRRARGALETSEEAARRAAERDVITGLYNRAHMLGLLDEAMANRQGQNVGYALVAVDSLRTIGETYGQQGADEIMATAAANIKDAVPDGVACARVAENEFALLWSGAHDDRALLRAAVEAASKPHWLDSVIRVSARAGFAQAPRDAERGDDLARCAELALRAAFKTGAGEIIEFNPSLETLASDQHFIRRELPRALNARALELHYQPIVSAQSGRPVGVEALLRWRHPSRGAIPPANFIPVAEQMGLIDQLGAFVLRNALMDAKRWPDLYISVNLSPLQVRDRRIVDLVRECLAETGIAPNKLILEITEGVLIDNPEEMRKRIEELRALGVRIALDDFGSGYSSLGYLQRFAFDKIKIDRSFAAGLGHSANAPVIVQAIVALGRALGVAVVVEGVETEEQRVLLRLAGCDEMQGYLFAKPAPAQAIDRLVGHGKDIKAAVA
jgi:diguanylate cyclase (GGDEF)-like protein